jgi:hypothetical protein
MSDLIRISTFYTPPYLTFSRTLNVQKGSGSTLDSDTQLLLAAVFISFNAKVSEVVEFLSYYSHVNYIFIPQGEDNIVWQSTVTITPSIIAKTRK